MQTNPQHRKLSISFALLSLEGEEGKVKKKKNECFKNEKSFLYEMKTIVHTFLKGYHLMEK